MRRALLLAAFLAGPACAQEAPAEPPPPASTSAKDVAAWMAAHIEAPDWRVLAINPHGVLLASPGGVRLRPDGMAEADLRHEMFAPVAVGGGQMRSDLEKWLVDCKTRRHALMRISVYRGNSLRDEFASRGTETPQWLETHPGDEAAQAVDAICEAVAGKTPPKGSAKPANHP
ncbi:surface-adhesin E family protein [uncultured Phenylobacterium sp.]|uniref:surface-adhesin E family protein n=1 Tax=uncultured Phenylobacterium sp. TaxID=349273 RepID=UPI0025F7EDA0|nr:surface-adhesin E family protein [uncultured Phenylobacterium sp.]